MVNTLPEPADDILASQEGLFRLDFLVYPERRGEEKTSTVIMLTDRSLTLASHHLGHLCTSQV